MDRHTCGIRTITATATLALVMVASVAAAAAQAVALPEIPGKADVKRFASEHRTHVEQGLVHVDYLQIGDGTRVRVTVGCQKDGAAISREFDAATTWLVSAARDQATPILSTPHATGAVILVVGYATPSAALEASHDLW